MASYDTTVPGATAASVAVARHSGISLRRREALAGYVFILPAVLGFVLWTAGPMLYSLWMSFHIWDMRNPAVWTGLGNYRAIWHDDLFWTSLRATFTYAIVLVPLFQIVSFATAMLLNTDVRGVKIFRSAFYLPVVIPAAAGAFLWGWIFNPEFGLLNFYLRKLGLPKILWFQEPRYAMTAMVVISLWGFGATMVIYLAALQGIPDHLYEAAELDGAGWFRKLGTVTIPMMSPVIFFNFVLGIIGALQVFTSAYIITQGGPQNATRFYTLMIYDRAFDQFKMGYASALAWVLFFIILLISLFVFRSFGRMVYYEDSGK